MHSFFTTTPIIAMLHLPALPGTPKHSLSILQIIEHVAHEAEIYLQHGVDALLLENMHDIPYLNRSVGPEIVSAMTAIAHEIRNMTKRPCGVQILAGANREALAVALAANFDFIRAEGFVFAHVADEGIIESDAGQLLRYRKQIGADHIRIFTDIKKKHSAHAITADVPLAETAHAAQFFLSDGLIITGKTTGDAPIARDFAQIRPHVSLPVLAGSGVTAANIEPMFPHIDGAIIGSHFKKDGYWENPLDSNRIAAFMNKVKILRDSRL